MTTLAQDVAQPTQSTGTTEEMPSLTGLDRCDSCGAQAYVRVLLGGSELLFCAHHASRHEDKLKSIAEVWQDERHRLND